MIRLIINCLSVNNKKYIIVIIIIIKIILKAYPERPDPIRGAFKKKMKHQRGVLPTGLEVEAAIISTDPRKPILPVTT